MYAEVIVGIDGTDAGRDALALAQTLAPRSIHLALTHVRVLEAPAPAGRDATSAPGTREDSLQLLLAARADAVVPTEILSVLAPDVGAGLHDVAESRGADLLVVGSCRRSAIGPGRLGDDTRKVLDRAPCAVAVAPRGYRQRVKTVEVIGVAYDDSAQSNVALAHAWELALATGAKVVALHVVGRNVDRVGGLAALAVADVEGDMARARERLGYLGDAGVSVVAGHSGERLAAFSETVGVLICGSRHTGIVRRVALGSTSGYLASHCACPLIITTAADREPVASIASGRLATA